MLKQIFTVRTSFMTVKQRGRRLARGRGREGDAVAVAVALAALTRGVVGWWWQLGTLEIGARDVGIA
jgi:hypothetical protein